MSDGTKTCLRCAEDLPIETFSRHRGRPDGRQAYCKPCYRLANRASTRKNLARLTIATPTEKRCGSCQEVKPVADFYTDRRRRDGLYPNCRDCHYVLTCGWQKRNPQTVARIAKASYARNAEARRRYAREWAAANPERARAAMRQWKLDNRAQATALENLRRARKLGAGGAATPEQVADRVAYYGGRCWICRAPWQHMDHVKPIAAGGSNWPANLRPACSPCNRRKNSRWYGIGRLADLVAWVASA